MLSIYIYIQVLNHPVSTLPIHNINVAFAGLHARDGTCGATPQWFGARFGSGGTAGAKALKSHEQWNKSKIRGMFCGRGWTTTQLLFFFLKDKFDSAFFFENKNPRSPEKLRRRPWSPDPQHPWVLHTCVQPVYAAWDVRRMLGRRGCDRKLKSGLGWWSPWLLILNFFSKWYSKFTPVW